MYPLLDFSPSFLVSWGEEGTKYWGNFYGPIRQKRKVVPPHSNKYKDKVNRQPLNNPLIFSKKCTPSPFTLTLSPRVCPRFLIFLI